MLLFGWALFDSTSDVVVSGAERNDGVTLIIFREMMGTEVMSDTVCVVATDFGTKWG